MSEEKHNTVECLHLSKKGACNAIDYIVKKPVFKYRCPKTLDIDAPCEKYCVKEVKP